MALWTCLKMRYIKKDVSEGYSFNFPLIIFILAFVLIPVVGTLITSLFQDVSFLPSRFAGLLNYQILIDDRQFWQSVCFTLFFVIVSVALEAILGTIFALLLNEKLRLRGILRVSLLVPWAIPIAISARIWELIYNYSYGVANFIIVKLGISSTPINWLGSPLSAFLSIVIADVWKTTPFITIILLAGLSAIPVELYKQAMVDGTNFFQRFIKVTLPLLRPVLIVALLFRTIDAMRIFDLVYILTHGGPGGATTSISLYGYKFFLTGDFGYGSTISVAVFLITFLLAIAYIRLGKFREVIK